MAAKAVSELVECLEGIIWLGWTKKNGIWRTKSELFTDSEAKIGVVGGELGNKRFVFFGGTGELKGEKGRC